MPTLRTMHKRRKRKLMIAAQPCAHPVLMKSYYGDECIRCGYMFPDIYLDNRNDDCDYPDYEEFDDESGDCYWCGGDGYVDGYEDDAIFYEPGEMIRCSSCNGSGMAKDMTIW